MAKRGNRGRRNPLKPPNLQKLLGAQSVYKPPADIDAQVEGRVKLETAPAVNAINRSRQMGQHMYQLQSEEARGWGTALVGMLTGGKTGAEAEAYSKANFGGSYLAGIAMQEGTKLLTTISNDFNMKDWDMAAQLAEVYDQMPELREKFRADILSEGAELHQLNFDNRLKVASLVLEDWYKRFSLNMAATELGFDIQTTKAATKLSKQALAAKTAQDRKAHRLALAKERRELRKDIAEENKDRRKENQIDISSSIDAGVWVNNRGQVVNRPPGYPPKPPPRWKPTRSAKGGKGEPFEPTPRAEAMAKAGRELAEWTMEDVRLPSSVPGVPGRKLTKNEARNKAYSLISDELLAYGFKRPRIMALVNQKLRRLGYRK